MNAPVHNVQNIHNQCFFFSDVTSKPAAEGYKPDYRKDIKFLFCHSLNQEQIYEEIH